MKRIQRMCVCVYERKILLMIVARQSENSFFFVLSALTFGFERYSLHIIKSRGKQQSMKSIQEQMQEQKLWKKNDKMCVKM